MPYEYRIVDAFSAEPFGGNPAAVVLDARLLPDATMQRIATEFNLAETTFILPPTDPAAGVRFRWFTPSVEVDLCGHATIAAVHVLHELGRLGEVTSPDGIIRIETRSGILESQLEMLPEAAEADRHAGAGAARANRDAGADPVSGEAGGRWQVWLELPPPALREFVIKPSMLRDGLRIDEADVSRHLPSMLTRDRDLILFVRDTSRLRAIRPNFSVLAEQCSAGGVRGVLAGTVGNLPPHVQVETRFFAPAVGICEDPVTGSACGPLLAYLVLHGLVEPMDGIAGATCLQGIPGVRSGLARILGRVDGRILTDVQIGGRATTVMRGTLAV